MNNDQIYLDKAIFIDSKKGKITEHYKFLKEIGRGVAGIVYKASSKQNPLKLRAIKKVVKKNAYKQTDMLNEVVCLKEVDHPCIIRLYETFEDEQYLYYVTDFCEGGELFDYLERKCSLDEIQARVIFTQMLNAIKYCHGRKIAHRDLKPENFLLLGKPTENIEELSLKLIDFGLSFMWKESMLGEIAEIKKNKMVGTAYYIAPQVISGTYDQRCDIWSLGVILYILVTGIPPFDGDSDKEILKAIQKQKYTFNIPEMEVVSLFLKDLIRRMLKPADDRITLDQIYQHPWMNVKIHKSTLKVDFRTMANFSKFSKIKTIAATYIASQLAAQDIAKYEKVFQELDENHDGFLSLEELHHYMIHNKNSTNQVSFQELKNLIDFVDTDKNGKINYTQFIASTLEQHVIQSKNNLRSVFSMLDKDGNNYVDKNEVRSILNQHGHINEQKTQADLNQIFNSADINKDGRIDFEEFVSTICKAVI